MDWSAEVVAALRKQNQEHQDARVSEILADPETARMMRSMRGMIEFGARNQAPTADILLLNELISSLNPSDARIVQPLLAFIVWSIHPTHFGVHMDAEYFDLSTVVDVGRILKIVAEAEDTTSYKLKVLLVAGNEGWVTEQFDSLDRFGNADIHVYREDSQHAVVTVVPAGTGMLIFTSAVPKVCKADLTKLCPNCCKRNKDTAVKCFGCKRAL